MIDLSEIVQDPDFAQAFTLQRNAGTWVAGKFVTSQTNVPSYGIISVATGDDLLQIPEGDRVGGMMVIHTAAPIYETSAKNSGTSDTLVWHGDAYRISNVLPYVDWGYYKAFAVRTTGN